MHFAHVHKQKLARLVLAYFIALHTLLGGIFTTTGALAHGGQNGAGIMVICADGGFQILPGGDVPPTQMGQHECLCPCAIACSGLDPTASGSGLVSLVREPDQQHQLYCVQNERRREALVSSGSPRSPPLSA